MREKHSSIRFSSSRTTGKTLHWYGVQRYPVSCVITDRRRGRYDTEVRGNVWNPLSIRQALNGVKRGRPVPITWVQSSKFGGRLTLQAESAVSAVSNAFESKLQLQALRRRSHYWSGNSELWWDWQWRPPNAQNTIITAAVRVACSLHGETYRYVCACACHGVYVCGVRACVWVCGCVTVCDSVWHCACVWVYVCVHVCMCMVWLYSCMQRWHIF